jgi:hypothetical protein
MQTSPAVEKARSYWREKLDAHATSLNTLMMSLAGGLLAFSAGYVKDADVALGSLDKFSLGTAVAGATISLVSGGLRVWLRARLYDFELSTLQYFEARALSAQIAEEMPQLEAALSARARELLRRLKDSSDEVKNTALDELYQNFDPGSLQSDAVIEQGKAVLAQLNEQKALRLMGRLAMPQVFGFLIGALGIAVVVFHKLCA